MPNFNANKVSASPISKSSLSQEGFENLPAEVRNIIYTYALVIEAEESTKRRRRMFVFLPKANPTWTGTYALAQASPKTRLEYRPLFLSTRLAKYRITLHWCSLPRWLSAFYPSETDYVNAPRELILHLDGQSLGCSEVAPGKVCSFEEMSVPQIDILPLLKMKLACPERKMRLLCIRWHDDLSLALFRGLVDDVDVFDGAVERLGAQFEGRDTGFLRHVGEGRIAQFLVRADIDDLDEFSLEEEHLVVEYKRGQQPVGMGSCTAVRTIVFREVNGEFLFFSRTVQAQDSEEVGK